MTRSWADLCVGASPLCDCHTASSTNAHLAFWLQLHKAERVGNEEELTGPATIQLSSRHWMGHLGTRMVERRCYRELFDLIANN